MATKLELNRLLAHGLLTEAQWTALYPSATDALALVLGDEDFAEDEDEEDGDWDDIDEEDEEDEEEEEEEEDEEEEEEGSYFHRIGREIDRRDQISWDRR